MTRASEAELRAARRAAEAIIEFLVVWEEGSRSRTPKQPTPEVKVQLPQMAPDQRHEEPLGEENAVGQNDPAQLLTTEQVAKLLGCSPRTVYRLADGAKLPRPRKLGSMVRWPRGEIVAWIEAGCPRQRRVR
jgi:excisionase family DNA binding protein